MDWYVKYVTQSKVGPAAKKEKTNSADIIHLKCNVCSFIETYKKCKIKC